MHQNYTCSSVTFHTTYQVSDLKLYTLSTDYQYMMEITDDTRWPTRQESLTHLWLVTVAPASAHTATSCLHQSTSCLLSLVPNCKWSQTERQYNTPALLWRAES